MTDNVRAHEGLKSQRCAETRLSSWALTTLACAYLGYTMPPGGSFANTLICMVIGMIAGAALGFFIPIALVIFLIGAIIYAVFLLLL